MIMNKEKITVTIGLDGNVEIAMSGFKGKSCEAKSKFLEDALGMSGGGRKKLPEYYQQETVSQTQRT